MNLDQGSRVHWPPKRFKSIFSRPNDSHSYKLHPPKRLLSASLSSPKPTTALYWRSVCLKPKIVCTASRECIRMPGAEDVIYRPRVYPRRKITWCQHQTACPWSDPTPRKKRPSWARDPKSRSTSSSRLDCLPALVPCAGIVGLPWDPWDLS